MLALELYRSIPRYLAARTVGARMPGLLAGPVAPLRPTVYIWYQFVTKTLKVLSKRRRFRRALHLPSSL